MSTSTSDTVRCPAVVMRMNKARTALVAASGRRFAVWELPSGRLLCARELPAALVPEPLVRCVALSHDAALCATAGDDKVLRVWDVAAAAERPEAAQGTAVATPKRLTDVAFDSAGSVVFADKFGDVYRLPLPLPMPLQDTLPQPPPHAHAQETTAPDAAAEADASSTSKKNRKKKQAAGAPAAARAAMTPEDACILGHCSMLTAMALSADEALVATGDRDEHVRVSRYPDAHNIVSYCLGHTSSVFGTVFCGSERLCSGGGDGALRLWRVSDGEELACARPAAADSIVVACDWCAATRTVAAYVEGDSRALLYRVGDGSDALEPVCALAEPSPVLGVLLDASGRVLVATERHGIRVHERADESADAAPFADDALGSCTAQEAAALAAKYACVLSKRFVFSRDGTRPAKRPRDQPEDD